MTGPVGNRHIAAGYKNCGGMCHVCLYQPSSEKLQVNNRQNIVQCFIWCR
jgi:hypothetical protein